VNVAKVAKHGAATASSSLHLVKLHGMANKVKDGGSLARHLQMLINLKSAKAAHRLRQTITSAVPGGGIVSAGVNIAMFSVPHTVGLGLYAETIVKAAEDIHWGAYRELKLLRGSTKESGPCLRMIRELTTRSIWFSVKDINNIVMEPNGYKVIVYKLKQT
jgi:hypothetical protein